MTEISAGAVSFSGVSPTSVQVDPSGRFLYVTTYDISGVNMEEDLHIYTINRTDRTLSEINGSPFSAGDYSYSVMVTKAVE